MLTNNFPVSLFIGLVMGIAPGLGKLMVHAHAHAHADAEKQSPVEWCFEAFEDARMKFEVRDYLTTILLNIFVLEIVFLFFCFSVFLA